MPDTNKEAETKSKEWVHWIDQVCEILEEIDPITIDQWERDLFKEKTKHYMW